MNKAVLRWLLTRCKSSVEWTCLSGLDPKGPSIPLDLNVSLDVDGGQTVDGFDMIYADS